MKSDIHPAYKELTVTCSCGNSFKTRSTLSDDDLHLDVPVTVSELILGTEVQIPTADGMTKVKVPPRSANGRTLRLPGKGVANTASKGGGAAGHGHLFLHLQAVLPTGDDPEIEELARKLEAFYVAKDPREKIRWEAK